MLESRRANAHGQSALSHHSRIGQLKVGSRDRCVHQCRSTRQYLSRSSGTSVFLAKNQKTITFPSPSRGSSSRPAPFSSPISRQRRYRLEWRSKRGLTRKFSYVYDYICCVRASERTIVVHCDAGKKVVESKAKPHASISPSFLQVIWPLLPNWHVPIVCRLLAGCRSSYGRRGS